LLLEEGRFVYKFQPTESPLQYTQLLCSTLIFHSDSRHCYGGIKHT